MLKWTGAGPVADPTTVQIRLTPEFQGRMPVGLEPASRALTLDEVRANLRYFALERAGPRQRPCTRVVFGGDRPYALDGLVQVVAEARSWGFSDVVGHLNPSDDGWSDQPLLQAFDRVTLRHPVEQPLPGWVRDARVTANVVLSSFEAAEGAMSGLRQWCPRRVVFSYPFATTEPLISAAQWSDRLAAWFTELSALGAQVGVKGVPPCLLPEIARAGSAWRSANRWYVDAEHQREEAQLFFPALVRFAKRDSCRFCALGRLCDGAAERWLQAGLFEPLEPIPLHH